MFFLIIKFIMNIFLYKIDIVILLLQNFTAIDMTFGDLLLLLAFFLLYFTIRTGSEDLFPVPSNFLLSEIIAA